jgi:hypothetical protein
LVEERECAKWLEREIRDEEGLVAKVMKTAADLCKEWDIDPAALGSNLLSHLLETDTLNQQRLKDQVS